MTIARVEKKRSKDDTNPLDGDYAKRADEAWGEPRRDQDGSRARESWPTEAPTKRYDKSIPFSYPSINVPPTYQARSVTATAPTTHAVSGLGLPANITRALPYAPFFIGAAAAALELLFTPRRESRIRSNAAQGLVLHLAAIAISLVLNTIGRITGSGAGSKLFWAASTVFFVIATIRAWKGNPFHIPAAEEPAEWLNERIGPQRRHKKK
jgi:uncharacterized membrane protein